MNSIVSIKNISKKFDKTYVKSKYIKSMRVNKDGNLGSKNTLNEDTMHKLEKLVDRKIDEARDKILEGDFSINPKSIDNEFNFNGLFGVSAKTLTTKQSIVSMMKVDEHYSNYEFLDKEVKVNYLLNLKKDSKKTITR